VYFQTFALPGPNDKSSINSNLTLLIKSSNGTEALLIPLNGSQSSNISSIGPIMDLIVKNQNGENVIAAFHVQNGCEMGGPLHGCVQK